MTKALLLVAAYKPNIHWVITLLKKLDSLLDSLQHTISERSGFHSIVSNLAQILLRYIFHLRWRSLESVFHLIADWTNWFEPIS